MKIKGTILFKEQQRFHAAWIWYIIILCLLSATGVIVWLTIQETEQTKMPPVILAFFIPFELLLVYLIYITRLETIVSSEGIYYKWWPFQRSFGFIHFTEIKEARLRSSPPLNYGYHWRPGFGKVHNAGPGKGLQFVLKSGKKIFIGSQKVGRFREAVEKLVTVFED